MSATSSRSRAELLNKGFTNILVFSFIVHAGVLGGVVFAQQIKPRPVVVNSIPVQLVKLGKQRDPSLLPQITRPPPPPPDEGIALDTANKERPNQPTKDQPKSKDPELSDAAKRLLDSQPDPLDRAVGRIEEDEGSPDGSRFGTVTEGNAASGYYAQVSEILHRNYKLPATIADSERRFLSADVVLFIERDGTISRYEFVQAHPNEAFKRALELLLQSTKLPPPPPTLAGELNTAGIQVRFKPRS